MKVYSISEARQSLSTLLEEAAKTGLVRIRRRGGQTFIIKPEQTGKSLLDIEGVDLGLSKEEIISFIQEGRRA